MNNVVRLYGLPKVINSDRDVRLTSKFWNVFKEILGISKTVRTATYTPNSNGKVERTNQVLVNTLRSLCNTVGSDWGENLALAEFDMNTEKHSSIDISPFNLVHLREPLWSGTFEKPDLDVPATTEMADSCFTIFTRARDCLEASKLRTERALVSQRRSAPQFVEGTWYYSQLGCGKSRRYWPCAQIRNLVTNKLWYCGRGLELRVSDGNLW